MTTRCERLEIKGIVQGVGFRPFVYNLAVAHHLAGYVLNDARGVHIEVEGVPGEIDRFVETIRTNPPPLAVIFEMKTGEIAPVGYTSFDIRASEGHADRFVPISPEIATCEDCLKELFTPSDRRYRYPFINCTNCGPRFTIVKDIPYDRKFTTMAPFPMCPECQSEYDDPGNRRFHAQPNACPVCGPQLMLLDASGNRVNTSDVLTETCDLLKAGKILAIKGLGGYHLACDALNETAVSTLRSRKFREYKPFALMVRDTETAAQICYVNPEEEKLLTGIIRPIVLLRKREDTPVVRGVAPNQNCLGLMLPYTPLHHVLLAESKMILVMTSGNISSEPIVYKDEETLERLSGIPDYYLLHNREIHIRTDDSVSRVWRGKEIVLRRSRGYVPYPIYLPNAFETEILGCGAELKNAFCLTREQYAFVSHHIGDLENLETLSSFESGIEHFKRIFNISPRYVAYDLHPGYLSTQYALSRDGIPKIGVQHHHAHIAACMAENGIEGEVIGVSFDGTGYGTDGKIWGGEFLLAARGRFERMAHLEYVPLPSGEKAIKEPWRMASSYLHATYGDDMMNLDIPFVQELNRGKWFMMKQMIERGLNSPLTSSAGRFFDAVSALLGIRKEVYYEGQAAIELEMEATEDEETYAYEALNVDGKIVLSLKPMIRGIVSSLSEGTYTGVVAARIHNSMAQMILETCLRIRSETTLSSVALSGGVFQNMRLLDRTFGLLNSNGFEVHTHTRVPPNDGGIALGQAIVANELIKLGRLDYPAAGNASERSS